MQQLEIPSKRITFLEELGRGAFGTVHKGVLRELPKVEVFYKPREQRVEIKEAKVVAIKTLLGEEMHCDMFIFDCLAIIVLDSKHFLQIA